MKFILAALVAAIPMAALADSTTYTVTDPTDSTQTIISVPAGFPVVIRVASTAPSGPAVTNSFGTWTWGTSSAPSRPGEYNQKLNGVNTGIGTQMVVVDGTMYINTASQGWFVYSSAGYDTHAAP